MNFAAFVPSGKFVRLKQIETPRLRRSRTSRFAGIDKLPRVLVISYKMGANTNSANPASEIINGPNNSNTVNVNSGSFLLFVCGLHSLINLWLRRQIHSSYFVSEPFCLTVQRRSSSRAYASVTLMVALTDSGTNGNEGCSRGRRYALSILDIRSMTVAAFFTISND